jgi:hypothetical protein
MDQNLAKPSQWPAAFVPYPPSHKNGERLQYWHDQAIAKAGFGVTCCNFKAE